MCSYKVSTAEHCWTSNIHFLLALQLQGLFTFFTLQAVELQIKQEVTETSCKVNPQPSCSEAAALHHLCWTLAVDVYNLTYSDRACQAFLRFSLTKPWQALLPKSKIIAAVFHLHAAISQTCFALFLPCGKLAWWWISTATKSAVSAWVPFNLCLCSVLRR